MVTEIRTWLRGNPPSQHLQGPSELPDDWSELPQADITLLALPDDQLEQASRNLPDYAGLVVHGSGATPMDVLLPRKRRGVIYPLQTLSKDRDLPLENIPVLIESADASDLKLLMGICRSVFPSVREVDSEARLRLHLAAVIANNFTNQMYAWSAELCSREGVPFEFLLPLIRETAEKVRHIPPREAQTGPAIRGDKTTLDRHQKLLDTPLEAELYRLLSAAINFYNEKELQGTPSSD